jgi:hypothetical protein
MGASAQDLEEAFGSPRYSEMASSLAPQYVAARPFPHLVIDDFLPDPVAARVLDEFPASDSTRWSRYDKSVYSKKLAANGEEQLGPFVYSVLRAMNSPPLLGFLETLTQIPGLIPDPYLEGGGLHQILPGGYLKIHADFNVHSRLNLDRRINLLLYLNRDWREEYGGHLELWDRDMRSCGARVLPVFNRAVVFSTTDVSFHGHPTPLSCPEGVSRKSMALYYYSAGRPRHEESPSHSTLWQIRPGEPGPAGSRMAWARRIRWLARILDRLPRALRQTASSLDGFPG